MPESAPKEVAFVTAVGRRFPGSIDILALMLDL
jgi:hypothetical protein